MLIFSSEEVFEAVRDEAPDDELFAFMDRVLGHLGKDVCTKKILDTVPDKWTKDLDLHFVEDSFRSILERVIKAAKEKHEENEEENEEEEQDFEDEEGVGGGGGGEGFYVEIPLSHPPPPIPRALTAPLVPQYIHNLPIISFRQLFDPKYKLPPWCMLSFKNLGDGVLYRALWAGMRGVLDPARLGLTQVGDAYQSPLYFPAPSTLAGISAGSGYAFGGFFDAAALTDPLYGEADAVYRAGLSRVGAAISGGTGKFAMIAQNSLGPAFGSSAVAYLWLFFYLHRMIPLLVEDTPAAVAGALQVISTVVSPLANKAELQAQLAAIQSVKHAKQGSGAGGGGGGQSGGDAAPKSTVYKMPPFLADPAKKLTSSNCGWHSAKEGEKGYHAYDKCFLIPAPGGKGGSKIAGPKWLHPFLKDKTFPAVGQSWNDANDSE